MRILVLSTVVVVCGCALCMAWVDRDIANFFFRHDELKPLKVILKYWTQWSEAEFYLAASFIISLSLFGSAWALKATSWYRNMLLYARRCAFIGSAIALSGTMVVLVKVLLGRARPNEFLKAGEYGFQPFSFEHHYHSFPSGHAATSVALTGALAVLFPRLRWPLLLLGVGMAFIRVVITAHYLSDFVAGCYLGMLGVVAAQRCFDLRVAGTTALDMPVPETKASPLAADAE